jgi:type II secretory pathway pseudopilin PulG
MTRRTLEIAAFCAALLIAALAIHAWLSSRDEQQRLQSTLAAQKQILDAADTREQTRQATLNDALAKIEKLKRAIQTPQQILRDLPQYLPLPQPITFAQPATDTYPQQGTALPTKSETAPQPSPTESIRSARTAEPTASSPSRTGDLPRPQPAIPCDPDDNCLLEMPSADLKPLYDFTQNCRECQLRLTVAQQDHADDLARLDALTRQRDAAITAAKGGTFWRRLRRNALWFVVGAGVGAAAAHIAATR